MRNLKKILALVLALVMSLSLMATAGATDTTAENTESPYQTAVDVLKGLGVIKGDAGGDRLTDPITRAEVTALLYRIATGDVKDEQTSIHTGVGFTDVNIGDWYTGYISYCYIAEIIKGNPDGTFDPNANINGYATLAMILRAMGYDKKGEFVGDGWEIRTASTAKQIGILEGITDTQLSGPATRSLVFQILFRAILKDTVRYNALHEDYDPTGETLGYITFKLRDVTGVVVANKWANLNSSRVLADGKTDIVVTGETKTTRLDIDSELTDMGENRHFYLAGNDSANVLAMDEEGVANNVYSNKGAAAKVSDSKITVNADTEQYVNFDFTHEGKSEYRLEYRVVFDNSPAYTYDGKTSQEWFEDRYDVDLDDVLDNANRFDTVTTVGYVTTYTRVIPRNDGISADDIAIMEGIFSVADNNTSRSAGIDGYVFAGTNSQSDVNRNLDLSDEMSWNAFYDAYIANRANTKVTGADNGEWLKVVDNNNDGVAEYVFLTEFHLDKAISSHTVKGEDEPVLDYYQLTSESSSYSVRELTEDLAVGDVVIYALIDGKANVSRADKLTDKVATINFKEDTLTTDGGETKGQSGIDNDTEMAEIITNMATKTEYDMYLDVFGYVRAYELTAGTQYGLITEAYYGYGANGSFVRNGVVTVELGAQDEDIQEYKLLNDKNNPFVLSDYYSQGVDYNSISLYNYLQPAISHLGTSYMDTNWGYDWNNSGTVHTVNDRADDTITVKSNIFKGSDNYSWWSNPGRRTVRALANDTVANTVVTPTAFDYGSLWIGDNHYNHHVSLTNIASYTMEDDGVNLYTASKLAIDKQGNPVYRVNVANNTVGTLKRDARVTETEWKEAWTSMPGHSVQNADMDFQNALNSGELLPIYAVDYVQLATSSIAAKAQHYTVHDHDDIRITSTAAEDNYKTLNNNYINAIHSTQYYIVDGSGQTYITDYANLPAIDGSKIYAAYAVATNTNADKDGIPYWVADVIVIEVDDWTDYSYHSISAAYRNTLETNGKVRYLETLNNESADPELTVIPSEIDWGTEWNDFGFYRLFDAEMDGDELVAEHIAKITSNWNSYGIYAGKVLRMESVLEKGDYFDIELAGTTPSTVKAFSYGPAYVVDGKDVKNIHFNNSNYSDVEVGDEVIVVLNNAKNKTAFVIDVSKDFDDILRAGAKVPSWLVARNSDGDPISGVYAAIAKEQEDGPTVDTVTVTVKRRVEEDAADNYTVIRELPDKTLTFSKNSIVTLTSSQLNENGYTIKMVTSDKFNATGNLGSEITDVSGYSLGELTANRTIYVSYKINKTQTFTINYADTGLTAANINVTINGEAVDTNDTGVAYTYNDDGVRQGAPFTITFAKASYYSEYRYKIGAGEWVTIGAGVNKITGTIDGNTTVTIEAVAGNQVLIANNDRGGTTIDNLPASAFVGQTVTFTVTPSASNVVTRVYYTIAGSDGKLHDISKNAAGKYVLTMTSDMTNGITVHARQVAEGGFDVTLATVPTAVNVTVGNKLAVTKDAGASQTVTGVKPGETLTISAVNNSKFWISNISDTVLCGTPVWNNAHNSVTIPNVIGVITVTLTAEDPDAEPDDTVLPELTVGVDTNDDLKITLSGQDDSNSFKYAILAKESDPTDKIAAWTTATKLAEAETDIAGLAALTLGTDTAGDSYTEVGKWVVVVEYKGRDVTAAGAYQIKASDISVADEFGTAITVTKDGTNDNKTITIANDTASDGSHAIRYALTTAASQSVVATTGVKVGMTLAQAQEVLGTSAFADNKTTFVNGIDYKDNGKSVVVVEIETTNNTITKVGAAQVSGLEGEAVAAGSMTLSAGGVFEGYTKGTNETVKCMSSDADMSSSAIKAHMKADDVKAAIGGNADWVAGWAGTETYTATLGDTYFAVVVFDADGYVVSWVTNGTPYTAAE